MGVVVRASLILFLIQVAPKSTFGQPGFEKNVQLVMSELGGSKASAEEFLLDLSSNIIAVRERLESIASSDVEISVKEKYISELTNSYFAKDAIVQVSSKYSSIITGEPVLKYLNKLKDLENYLNYSDVELIFDPHYTEFISIESLGNEIEVEVANLQYFSGKILDSNFKYNDKTYKSFQIILTRKGKYLLDFKIKALLVFTKAENVSDQELKEVKRRREIWKND